MEGIFLSKSLCVDDSRGIFAKVFDIESTVNTASTKTISDVCVVNSKAGTLRGMHFQNEVKQDRSICVVSGTVYVALVELDKSSQEYGKWWGYKMTSQDGNLFIPYHYALGTYCVTDSVFGITDFGKHFVECESGFLWDDEYVNIEWPINEEIDLLISKKDTERMDFLHLGEVLWNS